MKLDYKIMGIPQRMDNIEILKKQLDLTSDDIFLDIEGKKNPMWTWKQTARVKADDDITHRVIIQDDAILCDDFKQFCEYLVNRFPDAIWMLYNHKDLTNGIPKYVVFRPGCCMGGVVSIIPIKYINDIIKLHEDKHSDFTNDDKFIHYWANNNNVDVFSTFPSVIGTIPGESSLGHNYDYEYPRCKGPLKHKWANATLFRYSNYKWEKLESMWNKEYYKKVFEKERNNVWRQVVNIY